MWCYHRSSSHTGLLPKSKGLIDKLGKTVAKVLHGLRFPLSHSLDYFPSVFRCVLASLYEGLSVRPSVRPSVRRSVGPLVGW